MSDETRDRGAAPLSLPDAPSMDWLRKEAKRRLAALRTKTPDATLADAQFELAKLYGFSSWRALKQHVDSLSVDGQLVDAAKTGDIARLTALLDAHPNKLSVLIQPYSWTLLHAAASEGQLAVVDDLIARGADVNAREKGDNTYPMHWAAAGAHLDIVRRLADAGGDVVGRGDDHQLEVIGWATCWNGCDDDAHREVMRFLLSRGARHHMFSAIAVNDADEVRRIVGEDRSQLSRRMSHNENFQRPLHFAVRMNRPAMVSLLLELGADPTETDGFGATTSVYAADPTVDRAVIQSLAGSGGGDLFTALVLGDFVSAERLVGSARPIALRGANVGVLHLVAKRGDAAAVRWLLDRGANPNERWAHWDATVTPLHLAAWKGHPEVVELLLAAGADPSIHDSMHDGDALGWAQHGGNLEVVRLLEKQSF